MQHKPDDKSSNETSTETLTQQLNGSSSRREMLQRLALMAAASGLPFTQVQAADAQVAPWVDAKLPAPEASGYGTDPVLITPIREPWPRTLQQDQLSILGDLADILLPAEGQNPAASELGVPQVIDHWISAPYPTQQEHRQIVVAGLDWTERESQRRFKQSFHQAGSARQTQIVDELAFPENSPQANSLQVSMAAPVAFFKLLRRLAAGAYYSSPHGIKELGYQGNVPIMGDYPGPDDAAMTHLQQQLKALGLTL